MKTFEEFKTRFENGEFDEQLKGVNSTEDVVKLAKELEYDVTIEDILNVELDDDKLSMVAGGKNDKRYVTEHNNIIEGNNNKQITF